MNQGGVERTAGVMPLEQVRFVGSGLSRPECVVAHSSGLLFAPDWTDPGGVAAIAPNGGVMRILATRPGPGVETAVRPNGIALENGGTFLLAHLGSEKGGIYRLWPDGRCEVVVDRVADDLMPPANFVAIDDAGRLWITVSTRKRPRSIDYRPDADTGYVAVYDGSGPSAQIAADWLGYANECLISPDGGVLFVNETFGRRLTAFDVDGVSLSNKRVIAEFGAGVFPDGLTLAADGALLVVSIVSNRVLRVAPDRSITTLVEDLDPRHVAAVEDAFQAGRMGRPHLDETASQKLRNISNLAFGGPGLGTAYLGCLLGDAIAALEGPVGGSLTGAPTRSWDMDLGPLAP